jgi:hypothetical protein
MKKKRTLYREVLTLIEEGDEEVLQNFISNSGKLDCEGNSVREELGLREIG